MTETAHAAQRSIRAAFMRGMTIAPDVPPRPVPVRRRRRRRASASRRSSRHAAATAATATVAATTGRDGGGRSLDWTAEPGDTLNFANWPLYIDKAKDETASVYYPSLDEFNEADRHRGQLSGRDQRNAEFFGEIQPQLQAGQDTGCDIIVITNGRELHRADRATAGSIELDPTLRPNFDANATVRRRTPPTTRGTGSRWRGSRGSPASAWNTEQVSQRRSRRSTSSWTCSSCVRRQGRHVRNSADAPDLVDDRPRASTPRPPRPTEWQEAADWLMMLRRTSGRSGVLRPGLHRRPRRTATSRLTMAWSGDVLYYKIWEGYASSSSCVPEDGALSGPTTCDPGERGEPGQGAISSWTTYYHPEVAQLVDRVGAATCRPVPAVAGPDRRARRGGGASATRSCSTRRPRARCCGPTTRSLSQDVARA